MKRRTNIEIMRIFAMFGIVIAHLIGYSPEVAQMFDTANKQTLFLSIMSCCGKIGVHIFFMITGYFLVNKSFKINRILKTWKIVFIYSALALIATLIFASSTIGNFSRIVQSIFPVTSNVYWFVTTYIIIILLCPAINSIIKKIVSTNKIKLFFVFVIAFYLINFVGKFIGNGLSFDLASSYRILTYIITYSVGALFSLHPPKLNIKKRSIILFVSILLLVVWRIIMVYILNIRGYDLWVIDDRDVFVFIVACSIFLLFSGISIKENFILNKIAGSTFAVYLIHENCFLRPLIWKTFDIYSSFDSWFLYLYPFIFGAIVFFSCILIEILRQFIDKKITILFKKTLPNKTA